MKELKIHGWVHHSGRQSEMEKAFLWTRLASDCILSSVVGGSEQSARLTDSKRLYLQSQDSRSNTEAGKTWISKRPKLALDL